MINDHHGAEICTFLRGDLANATFISQNSNAGNSLLSTLRRGRNGTWIIALWKDDVL